MYRLLIVDDEPVIVNGLYQLFHENPAFELDIRKAYSSGEALEIAKKTKLDILVSDIRMPQKNGLQLVDEIVHYWPSCRIIFLTGYSEFDYVYEAIKKNVENYILKTEGIQPVFEAVQKAVGKLEEENLRKMQQENARRHLEMAEPFLKTELIEALLDGEPLPSLLSCDRYAEVGFRIAADRPCFLLAGFADRLEVRPLPTLQSVQRMADGHLPGSFAIEQAICGGSTLVWLLQPDEPWLARFGGDGPGAPRDGQAVASYMKGILEQVQNECERMLDVSVSFGITGDLTGKWDTVRERVETLRALIRERILLGQNMVVVDLAQTAGYHAALYVGGGMKQEEFKALLVEQIHRYVQDNLSGDLSLTAIAGAMHFNPSYLSRYYKQLTGRNLIEHIQSAKLNVAMELMTSTSLKLNDIAMRAGFDSYSYFTTFFKKMTGQTPQEYRNAHEVNKAKPM